MQILVWPADSALLEQLADHRTPLLVLVEDGCEPPIAAECCQDWMWQSGSPHELRLRLRQLSLRALVHERTRPHIDASGMLHVGLRSVHLTTKEQRIAAVLLDRFNERVAAADLLAAGWPDRRPPTRMLAPRISVLRRRIAAVALELDGSLREGYVLRPSASSAAADPDVPWFDAELDAAKWLRPR